MPDAWDESRFWIKQHRDRSYDTRLTSRALIPLRQQWIEDSDLIQVERNPRLNLDFDWKRRVVAPADVDGVLSGTTEPWDNIEQFHAERDELELWKRTQRRVEKTAADLADRRRWKAERAGQRASGSTRQSGRPPLVNAVLRAVAKRTVSMPGWSYAEWADLFRRLGFAADRATFKNAARRGKANPGMLAVLTDRDRCVAAALARECPTLDLLALAAPGSPAAADIAAVFRLADLPGAGEDADIPVVSLSLTPYAQATPGVAASHNGSKDSGLDWQLTDAKTGSMPIEGVPASLNIQPRASDTTPFQAPPEAMRTMPAAGLLVAIQAAQRIGVMSWAEGKRARKQAARLSGNERSALAVAVMDRMVAAVGIGGMAAAMRHPPSSGAPA